MRAIDTLFSRTGKTLMEQRNISGNNFTFDTSKEASGICFLEIKQDRHVSRIKLVNPYVN
ncbi:MAG: hypothetical protein HY840_13750 [Bacteroidetes bacterium]|nr:hypothetical protein [Bacteroidota bacterium]